ncbi:unnamed protein product, partial [Timema podura]|nr:unnamed protein product [Timema podura]
PSPTSITNPHKYSYRPPLYSAKDILTDLRPTHNRYEEGVVTIEQMEDVKRQEERMEKQLRDVQTENKRLAEPLKRAEAEVAVLERKMGNYGKDKVSLANTKTRLTICQKELEDLKWENEVLQLRFKKVQ